MGEQKTPGRSMKCSSCGKELPYVCMNQLCDFKNRFLGDFFAITSGFRRPNRDNILALFPFCIDNDQCKELARHKIKEKYKEIDTPVTSYIDPYNPDAAVKLVRTGYLYNIDLD